MSDTTNAPGLYDVAVTMLDEITGETVVRNIDKTNAFSNGAECWELGTVEQQKAGLERWIKERGNRQHETILKLVSWTFGDDRLN